MTDIFYAVSESEKSTLLDSPPVLQNPTSHSVSVTWAVKAPATGWVEYGSTPQLGKRADAPVFGQHLYSDRFMSIRIENLDAGKPLYYRVAAAPVQYGIHSEVKMGEPEYGEIYQWAPLDENAPTASFVAIDDTHQRAEVLEQLMARIDERGADFTIWNGDIFNFVENEESIVEQVLRPVNKIYAAQRPVLFTAGNHDFRGEYARSIPKAIQPWDKNSPAGRCFAVRQGPLAIIGLDTAEDKPDRHPVFVGLAAHETYREAQRDWLQDALRRPEIASAPYLIAFCHIPLWGLPGHNPGDTLEGFAYYSRNCQQLWHQLLEEAGVQMLITGHMHRYRYDAPTEEHSYGQIVGGGPFLEGEKIATLICGNADRAQLEIIANDVQGNELGRWNFAPRFEMTAACV